MDRCAQPNRGSRARNPGTPRFWSGEVALRRSDRQCHRPSTRERREELLPIDNGSGCRGNPPSRSDRDGRREASERELRVIGTLGVLAVSAERGLLDLPEVIDRLRATKFRASPRPLTALVERYGKRSSRSKSKKSHKD